LIQRILNYERVDIYNPFYVSIINQEPQVSTISGDVPLGEVSLEERRDRSFLFEPGNREILHFFEVQILSSILQQKIREAHLATLGARVTTLQSTQENLESKLTRIQRIKLKTVRQRENKKQRNRLAGMQFWTD
jgi:F0F1-type ATP synthase gamma subunit